MSKDARPEFVVPTDRIPGQCYADGCSQRIPTHMLMCLTHWRRVPRTVQKRVWASGLADPEHGPSRLAARISVALKEGLPWEALPPEHQAIAAEYKLGKDGKPLKEARNG